MLDRNQFPETDLLRSDVSHFEHKEQFVPSYSLRNADMGSIFIALLAGT